MAGADETGFEIERRAGLFVRDLNHRLVAIREPSGPAVNFKVSHNKVGHFRSPKEQALEVARSKSYVCWSSHMSGQARHILMTVDGKASWDARGALGTSYERFKTLWGELMTVHRLKNAAGGQGWAKWDQFHLELPDSKLAKTDPRSKECLCEYVRLTRDEGRPVNQKFERRYAKLLEPYLDARRATVVPRARSKTGPEPRRPSLGRRNGGWQALARTLGVFR